MSAPSQDRTRVQEDADLGSADALRVMARAVRFVGPFRRAFLIKLGLVVSTLLPLLLLPWPVKIVIDNVIDGVPIADPLVPYPFFIQPFTTLLEGRSSGQVLAAAVVFQLVLFLLIGAFGTSGSERDQAAGALAGGHDTATQTENEANAGFSIAGGALGLFDFRWTMRLTQALNHHYRARLFERIQALPMTAFDDERIGDAVYRVMYDTPTITNACYRILLTPVAAPLNILLTTGAIALVFGHQPRLVASALLFIPIALVATLPFAGALRRRSGHSRQAGATTTSTAEEGMANILAVQSLGGEDRQRDHFDRDSWSSFSRYRAVFRVGIASFLLGALLAGAVVINVFLHVVDLVIEGQISRGDFSLLFTYFFQIGASTWGLGALWFSLQGSAAGLNRVFFLMDLPGESDAPDARELAPVREGIRIEAASFRYPDGSTGLRSVTLDAKLGQMIALVGPAGAGKTTLAYLVPRFLHPQSGRVLIDGADAGRFTLESLRAQISFVFQETVLFEGTVEENLRVSRPDADADAVRRAARQAGADEFIARLPEGYATQLGRSGGKLSVGQKQRLSIARALLRDAPILVLDEPTSALDPQTEQSLLKTLREASRKRLVIVIAHRLSTVRAADRILFLEKGSVLEQGTHEELMALENGAYRRYCELQTRQAA